MGHPPKQLVIGIPTASFDGKYYGRYPQGNKPQGAALNGPAIEVVSANANLATAIRLAASAAGAASAAADLTTGGSGADSYGITTYAMQSLNSGLNENGQGFNNNVGSAATLQWLTDATGSFARMTWPAGGGNAGPIWSVIDTTNPQLYMRWWYRRNTNNHSKRAKLFGRGYPAAYSNFTAALEYAGTTLGLSYGELATQGDLTVQFFVGSFPTLTGGSAFTASPHPRLRLQTPYSDPTDGSWHLQEFFVKHSSDGVNDGEIIYCVDMTPVLWIDQAFTCRAGGQGFSQVTLGDLIQSNASSVYEDFKGWALSHDRPVGRGF